MDDKFDSLVANADEVLRVMERHARMHAHFAQQAVSLERGKFDLGWAAGAEYVIANIRSLLAVCAEADDRDQ